MKLGRTQIPDLAVLQAFESSARHGSFTRAAAELNLTQSAVSRQIRTLEQQLGVSLFERIRQRVILSDSGRALLPRVEKILLQSEDMVLHVRSKADGRETLTVATLPTFGSRWLTRRLPGFLASYPDIALNISSRSQPFDLLAEDFDLAIHYGTPVWPHATCTYLCSEVIVPVASPSLIASHQPQEPGDLIDVPLLHVTTRPRLWAEWFEANDSDAGRAYQGHRFDQLSMIIEAATAGLGVALLPIYLIETELESGALQVIFDKPLLTPNSYYVVIPEGKKDAVSANAFRDWLMTQVRPSQQMPLSD